MEPRTSSIQNRLKAVEILSSHNIPVNVMIAPVIPSLNSHEILPPHWKSSFFGRPECCAYSGSLNGQIATIFEDWVRKTLPDRADRILHQIAECHDGKLNDSRWGKRIKGEGIVAQQIADTMALGKKRFWAGGKSPQWTEVIIYNWRTPDEAILNDFGFDQRL